MQITSLRPIRALASCYAKAKLLIAGPKQWDRQTQEAATEDYEKFKIKKGEPTILYDRGDFRVILIMIKLNDGRWELFYLRSDYNGVIKEQFESKKNAFILYKQLREHALGEPWQTTPPSRFLLLKSEAAALLVGAICALFVSAVWLFIARMAILFSALLR